MRTRTTGGWGNGKRDDDGGDGKSPLYNTGKGQANERTEKRNTENKDRKIQDEYAARRSVRTYSDTSARRWQSSVEWLVGSAGWLCAETMVEQGGVTSDKDIETSAPASAHQPYPPNAYVDPGSVGRECRNNGANRPATCTTLAPMTHLSDRSYFCTLRPFTSTADVTADKDGVRDARSLDEDNTKVPVTL
ncbi:hypothetical protein CBL_08366 [Carabus blaptoides fortunei]